MKQQPLRDRAIEQHLERISEDGTDLFTAGGGAVRIAVVHGTTLVNRMIANHKLNPTAGLVLGQAYLLALLASSTLKDDERMSLLVEADGPVEGLSAEANSFGQVRGYLRNSEVELSAEVGMREIFGTGVLSVMRIAADRSIPFQGQIEWQPGDLTENLAWYYANSEQTATLLDVNVHFGEDQRVEGAAGIILQALPDAPEGILEEMGTALTAARPLGARFAAGETATRLIQQHLQDWRPQLVGTRPAEFYCGCSHERFGRFLSALPDSEKQDILENGPHPLKTTCHNCNSTYRYELVELEQLFTASPEPPEESADSSASSP